MARALRLRGPLAADPTAQMLHVLLLVVAIWMAIGFISTLSLAPVTFVRVFNPAILQVGLISALVLIRMGYFRAASLVYLADTWVWATLVLVISGGIRSPA